MGKKDCGMDLKEARSYLDCLFKKRVRLSNTKDCVIESLSMIESWKYGRGKICIIVEDYSIPFFWKKMQENWLDYKSL